MTTVKFAYILISCLTQDRSEHWSPVSLKTHSVAICVTFAKPSDLEFVSSSVEWAAAGLHKRTWF